MSELADIIRKETKKWFGFELADEVEDLAQVITDAGYVKTVPPEGPARRRHVCGLAGFGLGDTCEICERNLANFRKRKNEME